MAVLLRLVRVVAALVVVLGVGARGLHAQDDEIVLATTTSVRDAGLLDTLLPPFERTTGLTVKIVAVGSGQAMELGRRGEADILILHDPEGEERFVAERFGIERRALMRNTFVIVGPPNDPAGIRGLSAVAAMRAIATAGALWVSRRDRSGTHVRELRLWRLAGVRPDSARVRETGQGMGATLVVADQLGGYTLSDIATFLNHKAPLDLAILVDRDSALVNTYHVILANPARFPNVRYAAARQLRDFLFSPETRRRIARFGVATHGRPLFEPLDLDSP